METVEGVLAGGGVASLESLAAASFAHKANLSFFPRDQGRREIEELEKDWVERAAQMSVAVVTRLCDKLHHRLIKQLLPVLRAAGWDSQVVDELKRRCLALSMQREENLMRTRDEYLEHAASRLKLLDVFESDERKKWTIRSFVEPETICVGNEEGVVLPCTSELVVRGVKLKQGLEMGSGAIVSKREFEYALKHIFAEGQLDLLDWNNILVAGGSVSACLTPPDSAFDEWCPTEKERLLREWFHKGVFESSDIDVFLFGLSSEEEMSKKVIQIFKRVQRAHEDKPVHLLKTNHTFTLVRGAPYRCIQIIRWMYKSKAEILAHFDIDSAAVGYDGERVVCLDRFKRAMRNRTNIFNGSLRAASSKRMNKYNDRGFAWALPKFTTWSDGHDGLKWSQLDMLMACGKLNLLSRHNINLELKDWFQGGWSGGAYAPGNRPRKAASSDIKHLTLLAGEINAENSITPFFKDAKYGYFIEYSSTTDLATLWGTSFGSQFGKNVKKIRKAFRSASEPATASCSIEEIWLGAQPRSDWAVGLRDRKSDLIPIAYREANFEVEVNVDPKMASGETQVHTVIDSFGRRWVVQLTYTTNGVTPDLFALTLQLLLDGQDEVEQEMELKRTRSISLPILGLGTTTVGDDEQVLLATNILIQCSRKASTEEHEEVTPETKARKLSIDRTHYYREGVMTSAPIDIWLMHFDPTALHHHSRTEHPTAPRSEWTLQLLFTIQTIRGL